MYAIYDEVGPALHHSEDEDVDNDDVEKEKRVILLRDAHDDMADKIDFRRMSMIRFVLVKLWQQCPAFLLISFHLPWRNLLYCHHRFVYLSQSDLQSLYLLLPTLDLPSRHFPLCLLPPVCCS